MFLVVVVVLIVVVVMLGFDAGDSCVLCVGGLCWGGRGVSM